ncbi:hypothetical protein [Kitasatospora purpeofusca]|uniref:hypothetical protein n=1 Tax=Kitasatospora purpeofusca TaxID=67352 RepID=UPI003656938D
MDQLFRAQPESEHTKMPWPPPNPAETIAAQHRTGYRIAQTFDDVPRPFEAAMLEPQGVRSALAALESATFAPIKRADLLEQHPCLSVRVPGSHVNMLGLLLASDWSGSENEEWLFNGSLYQARKLTREALSLDAGEHMSLVTAARLLVGTGWPLKPTEGWLRYCGFQLVDTQVELAEELSETRADEMNVPNQDGDYELAPPQPRVDFETHAGVREEIDGNWPATTVDQADTVREGSATAPLQIFDALEQLREFASKHRPDARLGDLLQDSEALPDSLRTLTACILAAVPGEEGWSLPETSTVESVDDPFLPDPRTVVTNNGSRVSVVEGEQRTAQLSLLEVVAATAPRAGSGTLRGRAWEVLNELGYPLGSQTLADRMGVGVNLRSLKVQLPSDPRFMRSDVDTWALTEWGLRPYTTIKELVAEELDRAGGSIPTDELISVLTRGFSINESSLRQTASSPPFTARGGVVRRLSDVRGAGEEASERRPVDSLARQAVGDDGPSADDLIDLMGL